MCSQGYNAEGQLGDGTLVNRKEPTQVTGNGTWQDVQVGAAFTCGIQTDSRLYCWVRAPPLPLRSGLSYLDVQK